MISLCFDLTFSFMSVYGKVHGSYLDAVKFVCSVSFNFCHFVAPLYWVMVFGFISFNTIGLPGFSSLIRIVLPIVRWCVGHV